MKPYNAKSWEVRAFLNGEKTAIVLSIKPQPWVFGGEIDEEIEDYKPHYQVGDTIYVRETYCLESGIDGILPDILSDRPFKGFEDIDGPDRYVPHYKATDTEPELCYENGPWSCKKCDDGDPHAHWKSPATMPQWASRIHLTVVEVKAVRLHDLTCGDAEDIGVKWEEFEPQKHEWSPTRHHPLATLWNERYAKQGLGWDANPWVWVVKVVKG